MKGRQQLAEKSPPVLDPRPDQAAVALRIGAEWGIELRQVVFQEHGSAMVQRVGDKRSAVYQMHLAGMSRREISRRLGISRTTVGDIVDQQGVMPQAARKDKIHIDGDLLRRLYRECNGWAERVHERLVEEEKIQLGYSTLTRLLREEGLGGPPNARCDHVPDEPGKEMQHDTSVYQVKLAGQAVKLNASLLYLRYSKRRYLKFYRVFNRFFMKCFFHEALSFWEHAASWCVIDNTNLARLRGSGSQAVIVPEMVAFAQGYGFQFVCHAIGHANRKDWVAYYTSFVFSERTLPKRSGAESFLPRHGTGFGPEGGSKRYCFLSL